MSTWGRGSDRVRIVGHRGVPRLHQENTVAGFERAAALGLDAVELDVQLTADGRLAVFHDDDLARLTGEQGKIAELGWDEIWRRRLHRLLPLGRDRQGLLLEVSYEREERIPLLEEVLEVIDGRLAVDVELKPSRTSPRSDELAARVAAVVQMSARPETVLV